MTDLQFAFMSFTAIFFVVDPFAAVPIFLSITARDDIVKKKRVAARASIAALLALSTFALAGDLIFRVFGITLGAFKIAGGLMLFLMAVDMMRAHPSPSRSTAAEEEESMHKEDVAIVPMAIPMLAGPGAIATVMVLMSRAAGHPVRSGLVFLAVALTSLLSWLLLRTAALTERLFQKTTIRIVERVMGLILAAVAVEFVVGGIRDLLPTLLSGKS